MSGCFFFLKHGVVMVAHVSSQSVPAVDAISPQPVTKPVTSTN